MHLHKIAFIVALLCTAPAGPQNPSDPSEVIEDLCLLCADVAPLCEQEQPGDILASIESFTSSIDNVHNDGWWPLDSPTVYDRIEVSFVVELSPALFEPHEPGTVRVYNLDWQTTSRVRFNGNMVGSWKNTLIYLQLRQDGIGVWYVQLGTMWGVPRRGTQLKESVRLSNEIPDGDYHFDVDIDQSRARVVVVVPDGSERRVAVATPDGGPLLHHGVFARFNHTGDEKGNETPLRPGASWSNFKAIGYPAGGMVDSRLLVDSQLSTVLTCLGDLTACGSGGHQMVYNVERLADGFRHYCRYECLD